MLKTSFLEVSCTRRRFLGTSLRLALTAGVLPCLGKMAEASVQPVRLFFVHLHTGERFEAECAGHLHRQEVVDAFSYFLRDFRTGDVHAMDPGLLDILAGVYRRLGCRGRFEVISGYRSPRTNAMLRRKSSGVARKSLHMEGRAIDVRLRGVPTRKVRQCAVNMRCGGVGYYAQSDFVHLDTGRVRFW